MIKGSKFYSQTIPALSFVGPGTAVMGILILFPIVQYVIISFTDWYLIRPKPGHPFVGLANYLEVFSLSQFNSMVRVTATYALVGVSGKMLVGLGTALLLNRPFKGRGLVRAIMVIPWAMPTLVVCILFRLALDPVFGLINALLVDLKIFSESLDLLTHPSSALISVTIIAIWRYFPFVTLMLLAALQGIPKELYEAASIDGAGVWRKFTKITWPWISPVWRIVLILQLIWTVKEFELIYLITRGGPNFVTAVIGVDVYLNAFQFFKLGVASAEGMFLVVFSIVFAIVYFRLSRREQEI